MTEDYIFPRREVTQNNKTLVTKLPVQDEFMSVLQYANDLNINLNPAQVQYIHDVFQNNTVSNRTYRQAGKSFVGLFMGLYFLNMRQYSRTIIFSDYERISMNLKDSFLELLSKSYTLGIENSSRSSVENKLLNSKIEFRKYSDLSARARNFDFAYFDEMDIQPINSDYILSLRT